MSDQLKTAKRTKFAVGHYLTPTVDDPNSFAHQMELYADRLMEVYFPWPGLNNARGYKCEENGEEERLIADLKYCRAHGMKLDLLINATCYGEKSFTKEQREEVIGIIDRMDSLGLRPEVVTTTSPYVAQVFKLYIPGIEVRASVNMRLRNTLALEYLASQFDSFYICRDVQRDFPTLNMFEKWCADHGKKLCMLVNSGCVRNCPWQVFHESLLAHDFPAKVDEMTNTVGALVCKRTFIKKRFTEFLRASWIRPEDIPLFEPHVSTMKLSTREAPYPEKIMKAYMDGSWEGNLLHLFDPSFSFQFRPFIIDNKKFPADWATSGIGGKCADNCTECGRCDEVMNQVLVNDLGRLFNSKGAISFSMAPAPMMMPPPEKKG